jgi:O-antigen/teichoic acid export membrane protein
VLEEATIAAFFCRRSRLADGSRGTLEKKEYNGKGRPHPPLSLDGAPKAGSPRRYPDHSHLLRRSGRLCAQRCYRPTSGPRPGDLTAVQVPSQLFGFLLCFGLPEAAVYFAGAHQRRATVAVSWVFSLSVGGAVAVGLWWLVPGYLHGHGDQTVLWLRIMLFTMVIFVPVTVTVNLLRLRTKMAAYNAMTALPVVLNTLFIVAFDLAGHLDLTTALLSMFLSQVIWYVIVILGWQGWPTSIPARSVARSQVGYGARLALGSLSEMVVARLDQFLLVGVVAPRQLGLYSVATTAAGLSGPAAWGVALVLFPRIRAASTSNEAWRSTVNAMRWTAASSISFAVVIGGSAPFVVPWLFGSAFRGSVVPVLLLLPGQILFDLGNVAAQKTMAENRPGQVSKGYLLAAVVTVAGLAIFIGPFGIRGAAVVTTVSQMFYFAYLFLSARLRRGSTPLEGPSREVDGTLPPAPTQVPEVPVSLGDGST